MTGPAADGIVVLKIGGGLAVDPGCPRGGLRCGGRAGRRRRLVVVPGGGPFADSVREFDRRHGLTDDAAHWMAILAMDQYAHVLAQRIERAVLVEEPGAIGAAVGAGRPAVLAPYRWMRSADVLPHSWEVTSDSVAAFIAGALDAAHLVLVKPRDGPPRRWWTGASCRCCRRTCRWTVIGWEQVGELPEVAGAAYLTPEEVRLLPLPHAPVVRRSSPRTAGDTRRTLSAAHRPAEEIALHLVAPLLPEQCLVRVGLHPLRHHREPKRVPHRDDRRGDRRVVRIAW